MRSAIGSLVIGWALFASCSPFGSSDAKPSDGSPDGGGGLADGGPGGGAEVDGGPNADAGAPLDEYAKAVLADGPIAYWRLDDAVGSKTALDSTVGEHYGNVPDGLAFGATGILRGHGAVSFPDGAHPITIKGFPALNRQGTDAFSIELWVAPSGGGTPGKAYLFSSEGPPTPGDPSGPLAGYGLLIEAGVGLEFERAMDNVAISLATSAPPADGTLTHVVGTYGPGGSLSLYVNGAIVAGANGSNVDNRSLPSNDDRPAFIGALADGSFATGALSAFAGVLDEIALYPSALSSDRVQAHYMARPKN